MRFDLVEYNEKADPPTIRWPGIDKGCGGDHHYPISVVRYDPADEDHRWLAVRIPGHSYWAGIGAPRSYAPTRIEVWELRKRGKEWEGRGVMDIDVRVRK